MKPQYKVFQHATDLTENITAYNYSDLLLQPQKKTLHNSVLFKDVPNENPKLIRKVFCSQAMVLALRDRG